MGHPTRDGPFDDTEDSRSHRDFDISTLPKDALREIYEGVKSRVRFNAVVETGVPGFIPRGK